jgi:hypothetical protein
MVEFAGRGTIDEPVVDLGVLPKAQADLADGQPGQRPSSFLGGASFPAASYSLMTRVYSRLLS